MRKFLVLLLFVLTAAFMTPTVFATTQQAYNDYLFQFDVYRQKYSDFQVAKNEYQKFKTLASQTTALAATKTMLTQRDLLLKAYLLLLNESLNEDRGLSTVNKQLYQSLIRNEITFLDGHSQLIPSIASIDDAISVGSQLESHYQVLQTSMRQIITGISLGKLMVLSRLFDQNYQTAQSLVVTNTAYVTPEKNSTITRWLLNIANKRSLYQQKIDEILSLNTQLTTTDPNELDRKFSEITKKVGEARQYLLEGTSFLGEVVVGLKYID